MKNIIDILLDAENRDPIMLTNEDGQTVAFKQVAVIPYKQTLYCILKPLDKIDGIADDEAVVFFVDDIEDDPVLKAETDEETAIEVFNIYYDLLEENGRKDKK